MSLLGMPFAMINLGCEMVYILHQRLQAQGIPPEKGLQVLHDIVGTMFEPAFLHDKLFVPQDMYSLQSTRKVFDTIAHSSIMKLSENSMDKLFDLMVMGVKYCLLCSTRLEDMVEVTLRHLRAVRALLAAVVASVQPRPAAADADAIRLLQHAEEATLRFYGSLSTGELVLLRGTLAKYFQDKRVRVSLFLAEGIQLQSGKLVMPSCINERVGLVRSFGPDGKLASEERLQLCSQQVAAQEFFCHPVLLGDNLYNKDRPRVVPPPRAADGTAAATAATAAASAARQQDGAQAAGAAPAAAGAAAGPTALQQAGDGSGEPGGRSPYAGERGPGSSKAAAQELDFLAALVRVGGQHAAADNFRLNLCFDDAVEPVQQPLAPAGQGNGSGSGAPARQPGKQAELHFGSGGRNEAYIKAARLGDVLEAVQLHDGAAAPGSRGIGDDLLDLMDGCAADGCGDGRAGRSPA